MLINKIELAKRENVYEDSYDLTRSGPQGPSIPDDLVALLFLLLVRKDELQAIQNSQSALPSRSGLVSSLVGQVLVAVLQLREDEYTTTLEEDEKLLETDHVSRRFTMALQVRLGEKRVLRAASTEARGFARSNKRMRIQEESSAQGKKGSAQDVSNRQKRGRFR